jgi:hypothetical protein
MSWYSSAPAIVSTRALCVADVDLRVACARQERDGHIDYAVGSDDLVGLASGQR